MKMKSRVCLFLVVASSLLIAGCDSLFVNREELVYSSTGEVETVINLNKKFLSIGDSFSPIEDCSSPDFPKCLKFDSTVIMLPTENVFDKFEDGYYEGRNKKLDVDYNISKLEIKVLGRKIEGFLFNVGHTYELAYGKKMLGNLKGRYFFTFGDGVLFYEHNSEIFLNDEKKERVSNIVWSTTGCGLFSTDCK